MQQSLRASKACTLGNSSPASTSTHLAPPSRLPLHMCAPPPTLSLPSTSYSNSPSMCNSSCYSSSESSSLSLASKRGRSRRGMLVRPAANAAYLQPGVGNAPATPDDDDDEEDILSPDNEFSVFTWSTIVYATNLARAAETYSVHPWYLLLGVLKQEDCTACKVLKSLGLEDAYGAWHEVLWALRVCDGLERKPFTPEISFTDRAYKVLKAAVRYAHWGGRKKVQSEDLLLALAASSTLDGLFPDLNLNFGRVRAGVERVAGGRYVLPFDEQGQAQQSVDVF